MENVLQKEMQHYFNRLNEAEQKAIVEMLKTFLEGAKEKAGRISLEEYNREIDQAMEEVKNGEVISHADVIRMSTDW